jgi:phospholipid/cholesterol/gamma-HCH transport system substrate-binding protein
MYASRTTQFIVGVFGLIGIAALSVLAFTLGRIPLVAPAHYDVSAMFDDVSGLKANDTVQIAGVRVGKVASITLSQKDARARVVLQIHDGVAIDDDAIASIKTSGIIGDKYIALSLGGGDALKDGGTIPHTESSFALEDVIGQFMNKSPSGGEGSPASASSPATAGSKGGAGIEAPPGLNDKTQNKPIDKGKK